MERLVYAVFDDHDTAQGAVDALLEHGVPEPVVDLVMHEGRLDEADLDAPAFESRRYAILGTALVAALGAVAGGVITGGVLGAATGLIVGAFMGLIPTALVGRTEPKPRIEDLSAQVRRGRVLVTVDLSTEHAVLDFERFFEDHGAREVGMT